MCFALIDLNLVENLELQISSINMKAVVYKWLQVEVYDAGKTSSINGQQLQKEIKLEKGEAKIERMTINSNNFTYKSVRNLYF